MYSRVIAFIAAFTLFNEYACRLHHRIHHMRRQNPQMQNPQMQNPQLVQSSYPMQPMYPPIPSANQNPAVAPSGLSSLPNVVNLLIPPGSTALLPTYPNPANLPNTVNPLVVPPEPPLLPNPGYPLGATTYPGNNPNFAIYQYPAASSPPAHFEQTPQNGNSNNNPPNNNAKLKRMHAPENRYMERPGNGYALQPYFNPLGGHMKRRRQNAPERGHGVQNVHQNFNSLSAKRRRKNAQEGESEMEKLLEEGKKILEMSTESAESKILGENDYVKSLDDDLEHNAETDSNVTATVIPIPKGMQLKTVSDDGKKHIEKTINITSSTQKSLSVGNSTEIENVVEMQMEKNIEDDKGASRGSEHVRIVETEHVKPIVQKKLSSVTLGHRKRGFHLGKFSKHHRGKRSEDNSEALRSAFVYEKMFRKLMSDFKRKERSAGRSDFWNRLETSTSVQSGLLNSGASKSAFLPRRLLSYFKRKQRTAGRNNFLNRSETSNSVQSGLANSDALRSVFLYKKMAKRLLSDFKRKGRTAGRNDFSNRPETATSEQDEFAAVTERTGKIKEENGESVRDKSAYGSEEMEDFLKHFLAQLIKFKRTREQKKFRRSQFSNTSSKWNSPKQRKRNHHELLERMKMVMNLNMTWDDKLQQHSTEPVKRGIAVATVTVLESETQRALTILYVNDKKEAGSRLLTVGLILSVTALFLPLLLWILPQIYKNARINPRRPAGRFCRFCSEHESNRAKGFSNFHGESFGAEEYPQLEWQSENGDWLSEKEIDFK